MRAAVVSFGHTDVSFDWCRALAGKLDIDLVLVFARDRASESVTQLEGLPERSGFLSQQEVRRTVAAELLGYLPGGVSLQVFIYRSLRFQHPSSPFLSLGLARQLRRGRYDLVHFVGNDLKQVQIKCALGRMPCVHSIHDYRGHSGERSAVAEWLNRALARRASVIAHSRNVGDLISEEYPRGKVTVVPFGPLDVYRQFTRARSGAAPPGYALFFGRVSPYKGVPALVEAARLAHRRDATFRLVVAGAGASPGEGGVAERTPAITWRSGYLSPSALAGLVEGSAFVVCPYTDASQSGVVMTAYAFGKPVLATRVGGLDEAVMHEQTGYLVPPGDVPALAEALLLLHQDPDRLRRYGAGIVTLRTSGVFAWGTIADQALAVYRRVAERCTS